MAENNILVCEQLSHTYANGVQALANINLSIDQGEYVAFVGQNGSGKTTLVKHFNGLLKPTQGKVFVSGESTQDKKVSYLSRKVGYVFQNPDDMLFCNSVEEEIAYGPRMLGFEHAEVTTKVQKILKELDLKPARFIPLHSAWAIVSGWRLPVPCPSIRRCSFLMNQPPVRITLAVRAS
jgi:energy-coupling factor transport system ATP-binding protein